MARPRNLILAVLAVLLSPLAANADAIIDMTDDAVGSITWNEDLTLGYTFDIADGMSISFNALAIFDVQTATELQGGHENQVGLNQSHQVAIWDSTGAVVVSTTVNPGGGTQASSNSYGVWVYDLIGLTTLYSGSYTIGAFYAAQSDSVMVQQSAVNNSNAIYGQGAYLYSSTFGRPLSNFAPNEDQYFGPGMLNVAVSEPGTLALLGLGLVGMAARRRRTV